MSDTSVPGVVKSQNQINLILKDYLLEEHCRKKQKLFHLEKKVSNFEKKIPTTDELSILLYQLNFDDKQCLFDPRGL